MNRYDVVVIGTGTAGEAIARGLVLAGKSVVVLERLRVGGECAYLSCMPSKAMLRSAQVRHDIDRIVELGASDEPLTLTPGADAFKWAALRRDRIADFRNDTKAAEALQELGIEIIRGDAEIISGNTVQIGSLTVQFTDLVISTGSTSNIPKIEGLEEIEYWTSDDALSAALAPKTIAIIGGGPVACELAQIFSRFGSEVTIVELSHQLAGKEHPEIAARLAENLQSEGITIHLESEVRSAKLLVSGNSELTLSTGEVLEVERVIIAAGRHPDVKDLGLEILSIAVDEKGAIETDSDGRLKENLHIWAAGDVTGIAPFTHTANYQARIIVENILGGSRRANYSAIPRAIYTDPAVASVGILPIDKSQPQIALSSFELNNLPRSSTDGEKGGYLILAADLATGVLIGAAAIGPHADEWMAEATIAIHQKIQLSALEDIVHVFPTYGEAFEEPIKKLAEKSKVYLAKK